MHKLILNDDLFDILPLYGIPETINIVEAIKSLYTNSGATVFTSDEETESFEITADEIQGDTYPLQLTI